MKIGTRVRVVRPHADATNMKGAEGTIIGPDPLGFWDVTVEFPRSYAKDDGQFPCTAWYFNRGQLVPIVTDDQWADEQVAKLKRLTRKLPIENDATPTNVRELVMEIDHSTILARQALTTVRAALTWRDSDFD